MSQIPAKLCKLIFSLVLLNLLVACGQFYGGFDNQDQTGEAEVSKEKQVTPSVARCKTDAREVLKKFCGECHQKSISSLPKALSVFNLEEDVWYSHMSESQMKGLKIRIRKADNIANEEVEFVTGCVACLLSENCR